MRYPYTFLQWSNMLNVCRRMYTNLLDKCCSMNCISRKLYIICTKKVALCLLHTQLEFGVSYFGQVLIVGSSPSLNNLFDSMVLCLLCLVV